MHTLRNSVLLLFFSQRFKELYTYHFLNHCLLQTKQGKSVSKHCHAVVEYDRIFFISVKDNLLSSSNRAYLGELLLPFVLKDTFYNYLSTNLWHATIFSKPNAHMEVVD